MAKSRVDELAARGVATDQKVMPNGEVRTRMMFPDGTGYIRTESNDEGAWQEAHDHRGVIETYIIQRGWVAFAWLGADGHRRVRVCFPGNVFTVRPGEPHNVYRNGDMHTVKHGAPVGNPEKNGNDWWPATPKFDKWTKSLTRLHVANQGGLSGEERKVVLGE